MCLVLRLFSSIPIFDRYVFKALGLNFIFGVTLFSSLGIALGSLLDLLNRIQESQLLAEFAVKILLLQMPEFISFTIPMAMLLATLIVYGRLSADSEIIALRSLGLSVYRLALPGLIFSLAIAGFTFFLRDQIVPESNYQAAIILEQALSNNQEQKQSEKQFLLPEYRRITDENGQSREVLSKLYYAEEFDGQGMRDLTIIDRSKGDLSQVTIAKTADWNRQTSRWVFHNGMIYFINPDGSYGNLIYFQDHQLQLPQHPLVAREKNKHEEMGVWELHQFLKTQENEPQSDPQWLQKLRVRLQEKISFPFICVVMAMVGISLGIRPQNRGKAMSFGLCILLIFGFYLLSFSISLLGLLKILSPVVAAWLPNAIGFSLGGWFLYRSQG